MIEGSLTGLSYCKVGTDKLAGDVLVSRWLADAGRLRVNASVQAPADGTQTRKLAQIQTGTELEIRQGEDMQGTEIERNGLGYGKFGRTAGLAAILLAKRTAVRTTTALRAGLTGVLQAGLAAVLLAWLMVVSLAGLDGILPTGLLEKPALAFDFTSEPGQSPLAKLYQENADRVVFVTGINVEPEKKAVSEFFRPEKKTKKGLKHNNGTGFIIHPDGYVLTNAHGVMRCLTPVVELRNGSQYDAEVVAVRTNHDLAVLKITAQEPLKAIPLETNTEVFVGDSIATIGCPPGLKHTLSYGIISGVGRSTIVTDIPGLTLKNLLQTDAPINPGASGGPWLNLAGHAVGMTVSKRGDADNIAFGIPVQTLREQVSDILRRRLEERFVIQTKPGCASPTLEEYMELLTKKEGETVGNHTLKKAPKVTEELIYQRLGLRVRALDAETQGRFDLRTNTGVVITEVDASRYDKLEHVPKAGDVLARLDNRRPVDVEELLRILRPYQAGEKVDLVILRLEVGENSNSRTRIDVEHFELK